MESRKILTAVMVWRRFLVLALFSLVLSLCAEDRVSPGEYAPKSGQPGKDVV